MDKKLASNLVLGLFVLGAFLVLSFFVFTMGGGGGPFNSSMELHAKFKTVKGLHEGSEVSLNGLRVGVVKSITISSGEDKLLDVKMNINHSVSERIRKDSVALVRTQGVLGDKYIELTIGSPSFERVQDGDELPVVEEPDLFTKSGDVIEGISNQFKEGGNVDEMLTDLSGLLKDIKRNRGVLHSFVYGRSGTKLNESLDSLSSILKKIDQGQGTIGSFVNDPTIYEDVKDLFGGAKRSSVLKYFIREFVGDEEEAQKEKKDSSK